MRTKLYQDVKKCFFFPTLLSSEKIYFTCKRFIYCATGKQPRP